MKKLPYLLILSGLISTSVFAEGSPLTGNIGVTTDYVFRGVSQSQEKPAISGGVDYSHASGLYAGTWLSNQEWVDAGGSKTNSSLEWDVYGGYRGAVNDDIGYDVGVIRYIYPGDRVAGFVNADTTELYLGANWKMLSVKYSHAVSNHFIGWTGAANASTRGSNYVELNASHDLGDGWGLMGHVGYQKVKHDNVNNASYTDWKLGVSKDVGFGSVSLAYTDTDADKTAYTWAGKDVANSRFILSFSKSF